MVFPDCYFFAERRLVNHTIETRKVKNFDDCELLCYLNDNCVSLNFKKDPDNIDAVHICELNNATHLTYDSDLTTDTKFYYRGSKVSFTSIFLEIIASEWYKNNYECLWKFSFIRSLVIYYSVFYPSIFLSSFNFFFSFRTLVTRVPTAKITQLVSLGLHSRDIDACVLPDSRENVVK